MLLVFLLCFLLPELHQDGADHNADLIQSHHGDAHHDLRHDIRRRDKSRHDKDDDDNDPPALFHPLYLQKPHLGKQDRYDRKLEHNAEYHKYGQKKRNVILHADRRGDLASRTYPYEEMEHKGEHDLVGKDNPRNKTEQPEKDS